MAEALLYTLVDGRGVGHYVRPFSSSGRALCGKRGDHLYESSRGAGRTCEACEAVLAENHGLVRPVDAAMRGAYDTERLPRMARHAAAGVVERAVMETSPPARHLTPLADIDAGTIILWRGERMMLHSVLRGQAILCDCAGTTLRIRADERAEELYRPRAAAFVGLFALVSDPTLEEAVSTLIRWL